jgi:hypothetical protein
MGQPEGRDRNEEAIMSDRPILPVPGDVADERGQFRPGQAIPPDEIDNAEAEAAGASSDPPPAAARTGKAGPAQQAPGDPDADANAPDPSRPIS